MFSKLFGPEQAARRLGCPHDLLRELGSQVHIIANKQLLDEHFPKGLGRDGLRLFARSSQQEEFDLLRYYNPDDSTDLLTLRSVPFVNSAAIAISEQR